VISYLAEVLPDGTRGPKKDLEGLKKEDLNGRTGAELGSSIPLYVFVYTKRKRKTAKKKKPTEDKKNIIRTSQLKTYREADREERWKISADKN